MESSKKGEQNFELCFESERMADDQSTWLEGLTLIGLYAIIAAAFWWG